MPPVPKIAKLPPELRQWLHRTFVERAFGDIEGITAELNALMKEAGVAITVGKSAVGVESQRVRRAQEAIAATTEAARLIAQAAPDEADDRSAAAMALVQSEVFELLLQVRESAEMEDPIARLGVMSEAALAMSRLSRSRVNQARWAQEVRTRTEAAAEAVAQIAKRGGLTPEQSAEIRAQILGIVKKET
jgi:hypothetical protein